MPLLPVPFTVADALQLEVFQTACLLAGAAGLERPIQWVHIVEIPDVARWVKGGELLLTDARTLAADFERQPGLVEALHGLGLAGLVFSRMGEVISLPEALLAAADRLGLPVIEVPFECHYVEVTEVILRRLVDREGALIRQAMTTHLRLTHVVLQGGDLLDLAKALAELVACAVRVESPEFQTLAYTAGPAAAHPHQLPYSLGRYPAAGLPASLRPNPKPTRVPAPPDDPEARAWIVAPVVVAGEVLAYLTLREAERPLNDLDLQTVESAATVAALILVRRQAIEETEARFQGDLLAQLVDGTFQENALMQRNLARYGLSGEREHQVLVLESAEGAPLQDRALQAGLQRAVAGLGLHKLAGFLGRRWVCILEYRRAPGEGRRAAEQLVGVAPHLRLGLGEAGRGWAWIHTSYQQALDALTIVGRLPGLGRRAAAFGELGFLHWLLSLSEAEL
ncbi:MAG: PucR family transcriptional regulator ligand-binding domain-containing protein, partial [Anaerolineales bacterium]|nr:PucR family transcriptional regulator ligand-binding domain-containing protein [Anaerolineales bacterium]